MERLDARLREIPTRVVHDLIAKIAEIDEFKGWWRGRNLPPPATVRRIARRIAEMSAAASTRIEASVNSGTDAQRGLRRSAAADAGRRAAPQRTGYAELLQAVFDGYRGMQLGPDLICDFHARLLRYSSRDQGHRGRYRTVPDVPTSHFRKRLELIALRSADPDFAPQALAVAIRWAAARLAAREFHPLLVIAGFILEFVAIRPFADGNVRLSCILTTLLLLQCGYTHMPYASLEQAIADRWAEYYVALRRSQANAQLARPDITPWLGAFLDAIRAQIRQARVVVGRRPGEDRLSGNQLNVLNLLKRNGEVTNRLVCEELGLAKDTAKQVLNRLVALHMLERFGAGRAVRYRSVLLQESGASAR